MIELEKVSFLDLLAPSIADDPSIKAIAAALDLEFQEVTWAIDNIILLPRLEEITDPTLIDLLAWQMHVDFYEPDFPLETKRELIRKSVLFHVYKGTKWAVESLLQTVFHEGRVVEWFEYHPKPHDDWHDAYRFKIITSTIGQDPAVLAQLLAAIDTVKPASRWLEEFIVAKPTALELWHASITVRETHLLIFMVTVPTESEAQIYAGVMLCIYKIITIYAPSE